MIEEYTPDGTFGRSVFSLFSGSVAGYLLFVSLGFLVAPALLSFLIVPLAGIVGFGLAALTVLTFWPVYLSVIGRIDSPTDYSEELRDRSSQPFRDFRDQPSQSRTDRLKRQYQEGTISEDKLERELEHAFENSDLTGSTGEWRLSSRDSHLERKRNGTEFVIAEGRLRRFDRWCCGGPIRLSDTAGCNYVKILAPPGRRES
ncbi:hypothetical protein JCM18750_01890 [Halostagnicola bangensis]